MKKITMILGMAIVLSSCGEDQQAKVCECSALYDAASTKADAAEEAGGDWVDTYREAIEAGGEKSTECEKFHAEIGDSKFNEMKKTCK